MGIKRYDYDRLEKDLTSVSNQSRLFKAVKRAMVARGQYKNRARGAYKKYGVVGSRMRQN